MRPVTMLYIKFNQIKFLGQTGAWFLLHLKNKLVFKKISLYMKRVIQGLEKENSISFLLASLSSTPA